MKDNRSEVIKSRRRIYIKVTGFVLLTTGLVALSILLLISSAPLPLILLAVAIVLVGLILAASPEALVALLDGITLLP